MIGRAFGVVLLVLLAVAAAWFVIIPMLLASVIMVWFAAGWIVIAAGAWGVSRAFPPGDRRGLIVWGSQGVYLVLFWTVIGVFTSVDREVEFEATWRTEGAFTPRKLVFDYVGHPGCREIVRARDLEAKLAGREGETVRLTLGLTFDFGDLRGYHVQKVDGVVVNGRSDGEGWIGGNPPWDALHVTR